MAKVLIVEDDITFSQLLEGFLQKNGHHPDPKYDVKSAIQAIAETSYNLLLLDYRLPDGNGLAVLTAARKMGLSVPVIIMTGFNDVRTAVTAIRSGAFDYITKPVNPDELLMVIKLALAKREIKEQVSSENLLGFIKGNSDAANQLQEYINLVSPTEMSVLIQGESGTGKEYAARAIHKESKRANKPFLAIDCGALSKELAASELFGHVKGSFTGAVSDKKGQFEMASGGTLFLDEVGNLSYEVQIKLLRALQERIIQPVGSTVQVKVDVRIITATNDDLLSSISQGEFREDLYHRMNEFKIFLPALRDRGKDLDLFLAYFISSANKELDRNVKSVSPEVMQIFRQYDWPGNLRELKNVVRRMVLLTPDQQAGITSLPDEMIISIHKSPKHDGSDLKAQNEVNERVLIEETLRKVRYNKSQAAKLLNIDRKTLYSKMEKYQIE
ncbi:MAG: sigma-54-dependent transcriptional regulator [Sphingobacteriaceae bacterium]